MNHQQPTIGSSDGEREAEPPLRPAAPTTDEQTARLMKFYGVTTPQELLAAQCEHTRRAAAPTAVAPNLMAENERLREGLRFYANRHHFGLSDESAWDTVSGEPANFWCDEAGTATIEDGSIAAMVLRGVPLDWTADGDVPPGPIEGEPSCAALSSDREMAPEAPDLLAELAKHPRWMIQCEVLKFGAAGKWQVWQEIGRSTHDPRVKVWGEGATPAEAIAAALASSAHIAQRSGE